MNLSDFTTLFSETTKEMEKLLLKKGYEYSGTEDKLANFKRGAAENGITALQVARVYAAKHWDSIATYIRDDAKGQLKEQSEPIEGRFYDLMNYCVLMLAIIREEQQRGKMLIEGGFSLQNPRTSTAWAAPPEPKPAWWDERIAVKNADGEWEFQAPMGWIAPQYTK